VIERVLVQFCAFKIGNTIGEFTLKVVFPESLPRTQASPCKKTVMRIWRVYMKYCSGERWRRGWLEKCTWTARRLAVLGRFLATKSISCKLCYFVVVYDFLLLVFVELTNVNILLSSGREFMLLFVVYMTYALFKVHENSNINMSTTEALKK
jgi:hypothetical protein